MGSNKKLCIVALMAMSPLLIAGGLPPILDHVLDQGNFYLGGDIGVSKFWSDDFGTNGWRPYGPYSSSPRTTKNRHLAWSVFSGYAHTVKNNVQIGIELKYNDNGRVKYLKSDEPDFWVTSKEVGLMATLTYLTDYGLFFSGKVGAPYVWQQVTKPGSQFDGEFNSGVKPELNLGLGYELNERWSIFVNARRLFGKPNLELMSGGTNASENCYVVPDGSAAELCQKYFAGAYSDHAITANIARIDSISAGLLLKFY